MHSEHESFVFINECRYALDQLFRTLFLRQEAIDNINRNLAAEIEQAEKLFTEVFIEQDQWSPNANFYYVQYMEQMKKLADNKTGIATEKEREQRVREMLARFGATEESMAVLASAILQLGKQVLSFRFGTKPDLQSIRMIGSQSIIEVIWEGRNHALHWEDSNPRKPVRDMLQKLQQDQGIKLIMGRNNALAIIAVLEWKNTNHVVQDLQSLVVAKAT
jgi:hypothetical protein